MFRLIPILRFLPLLVLALFASACSEDRVVELETLERDLLLTWISLERAEPALTAGYNALAQQDWLLLRRHYGNTPPQHDLQRSAARVELWMLNLRNAVSYGQPERATMAINLMQNELRALRPRFDADHPADHLYDFYYQWQDVVAASNDPMLCLLEWKEYEERYELAATSWKAYTAARPRSSGTLFPGYGRNAAQAEIAALAMSRGLADFATILKEADHTLAAAPSRMIEDLFFDYLALVTAYPDRKPETENRGYPTVK